MTTARLTSKELDNYFELNERIRKVAEEIAPLCTDIISSETIDYIKLDPFDDKNETIIIYVHSNRFGHDWYEIPKKFFFMSDDEIKDYLRKRREEAEEAKRQLKEKEEAEEKRELEERERCEYERLKKKFEGK